MMDPDLQAIWHALNQAQIQIILVSQADGLLRPDQRIARLTEAQAAAKSADQQIKAVIAKQPAS